MSLLWREPTLQDLAELREHLHPDSAKELDELMVTFDWAVESSFLASDKVLSLVREDDERLVAMIGIVPEGGVFSPWMVLTTAVEGRRLSLCRACKQLAKIFDVDMKVEVLASNRAGQRLFSLLGFDQTAGESDQFVVVRRSA